MSAGKAFLFLASTAVLFALLFPKMVTAEHAGAVMLDVNSPLSVSCIQRGGQVFVTVKALDHVDALHIDGFRTPVHTLSAGWSLTFARDGKARIIHVSALWRGKYVEVNAPCTSEQVK